MLEIKNVSAGYDGRDVIKDISLTVPEGKIFCVSGPNGCGKSTLLKTIAHILKYCGSIKLNGKEIASNKRKTIAKQIGMLSQISQIYFPYTVYETIALGRYAYQKSFLSELSNEDKNVIEKIIEQLSLEDLRNRLISELSGGQLQRVFLGRTLAQDPQIILLDEPTNHLDLKHQLELFQYLCAWVKEENKTVFGVFHDLNLLRNYADTVAFMKDGSLAACGTCDEVFTDSTLKSIYGIDVKAFMVQSLAKWQGSSNVFRAY
ncbi:MAG: ABC transporter ATP-binding protein [Termitinemataceae bacterium]|nr:MAG: ABC transporter ATP-binding protein [Termitinemataceae bacterium]